MIGRATAVTWKYAREFPPDGGVLASANRCTWCSKSYGAVGVVVGGGVTWGRPGVPPQPVWEPEGRAGRTWSPAKGTRW